MRIDLTNLGKRFNREWIFRNLSYTFSSPGKYAITGPNGSGKSTLLRIIAGSVIFNEGQLAYFGPGDQEISQEKISAFYGLAAPYLEVIEEMTLTEFFRFHQKMKGWLPGLDVQTIIRKIDLDKASHKEIRYFSSGMKQRVKLAQAIFSDTPLVLLDEPLTNLDDAGMEQYDHMVGQFCADRLVIVSSNDSKEYSFCQEVLNMNFYK